MGATGSSPATTANSEGLTADESGSPSRKGGLFGACCSSPYDAENVFAARGMGHAVDDDGSMLVGRDRRAAGVARLLEAEEESKGILMEAKRKRVYILEQARLEAQEEANHFESTYKAEIAKHEAQLAREISKYETTMGAAYEKQLTRELAHAAKRQAKAVDFLRTTAVRVQLELSINAQELLENEKRRSHTAAIKHASSSSSSTGKKARTPQTRRDASAAPQSTGDGGERGGGRKAHPAPSSSPSLRDDESSSKGGGRGYRHRREDTGELLNGMSQDLNPPAISRPAASSQRKKKKGAAPIKEESQPTEYH